MLPATGTIPGHLGVAGRSLAAAVSTGPRRCGNPHVCALSGHHGEPRALYTPVVDHSAGAAALARPRVTSLLSAAWQRRTTLVVAGGGYGKTTALRDIAAMVPPAG